MSAWSAARRRFAAIAVLTAAATAAAAAALGVSGSGASILYVYGAGAYVVVTAIALFRPAAITLQVLGGLVLVGRLLPAHDGPAQLLLLPLVAGIIATAELLAIAARLDTPLERDSAGQLQRAGLAATIGGAIFGAVALAGGLPGPTGVVALALAAGACVALAMLLVRVPRA